jgi:hypothetical protein
MFSYHAVVVHGLDHARMALRPGLPVTLLSAPGAALYGGCLWWRTLVAIAREEFPATPVCDILDCAASPGRAMAALRIGQRVLVLHPACPAFAAVAGAAATLGATVLTARPDELDLADSDAVRRLEAWLRRPPE